MSIKKPSYENNGFFNIIYSKETTIYSFILTQSHNNENVLFRRNFLKGRKVILSCSCPLPLQSVTYLVNKCFGLEYLLCTSNLTPCSVIQGVKI